MTNIIFLLVRRLSVVRELDLLIYYCCRDGIASKIYITIYIISMLYFSGTTFGFGLMFNKIEYAGSKK